MSQKVNLFNEAWVDLLFKDRNQAYGAFELRKDSSRRHKWGVIGALIFFALVITIPILYKQMIANRKDTMTEVTTLSNIEIDKQKMEKPKEVIIEKPAPPLKSSIKFTPPVIKPDEEVREDEEIKTQEELTKTDINISTADVKGTDEVNGMDIADLNKMMVGEDSTSAPYSVVEQMPEFPGGEAAMMKYLHNSVKYPRIATENGVQGKVYVNFVVDKSGGISNVKVVRGVDAALDNEAVRVIKAMPKWIPGKQNGETVRVSYTVPINFVLQ
ncbi:MAG TPA: energy transducer TonB [Prolixibacteraceae bacterium]|jgi:protein TonB|nr:energy transducer TonB [Prolixibacteraceae bacterium]